MLSLPRYLLGVADLLALAAFAWLAASRLRSRLLPDFQGAPASLATLVLTLALLLWIAELLGSFGLLEPLPYLLAVTAVGLGTRTLLGRRFRGRKTLAATAPPAGGGGKRFSRPEAESLERPGGGGTSCASSAIRSRSADHEPPEKSSGPPTRSLSPATGPAGRSAGPSWATLIALLVSAAAVIHFAAGVRLRLSTGMTGFDSTWYHGPLAAGFFQSGDTWGLHFLAPQYLAWFYPANAEIFHAVGMLAFHRDLLSPLLNLGWFAGCLLAAWCIGRPFGVAPWSLALGAIALSVPALADQAGEARNDLVATFFLLAAAAIALNAWNSRPPADRRHIPERREAGAAGERAEGDNATGSSPGGLPASRSRGDRSAGRTGSGGLSTGPLIIVGLAAGLAGGTKLTFLLPAAVLVVGLVLAAPPGARWRALAAAGPAALVGGGYWYLRNLVHSGNPLPWVRHLGPISLPAPAQPLGGRESHSVLSYLTDGSVWSSWFLPGLHDGLSALWPLVVGLALAGLLLCLGRRSNPMLRVLAAAGLAAALAWLIAPTGAEGPPGSPRGFESGLRFLTPALVLGLALLPATAARLAPLASLRSHFFPHTGGKYDLETEPGTPEPVRSYFPPHTGGKYDIRLVGVVVLALVVALGYPVERHYLRNRYANPEFTARGLDATFKWARSISGARIATTATRQYPLFGTDLSNHVQSIGVQRPHGGFVAPTTCRAWRRALDAGHYDYVVVTRDRIEPGRPAYPSQAAWTEGPGATVVLRKSPTVVFKLTTPLDPSACP